MNDLLYTYNVKAKMNEQEFKKFITDIAVEKIPNVTMASIKMYMGDFIINNEVLVTISFSNYKLDILPLQSTKNSMYKYGVNSAVVITNTEFTDFAKAYAQENNIMLIDHNMIVENLPKIEAGTLELNANTFKATSSTSSQSADTTNAKVDENPFNLNNDYTQNSSETYNQHASNSSNYTYKEFKFNKKSKSYKPIIIVGVIIGILLVISDNWYDIEWYFREREQRNEVESVEIVPNYEFDSNDVIGNSDYKFDPFNAGFDGEAYIIDNTDERFNTQSNSDDQEIDLVVGEDIEPGVYTIKQTGDVYPSFYETTLSQEIDLSSGTEAVNMSFVQGDKIEVNKLSFSDPEFKLEFIPQTEYIEYTDGATGMFVYGQSNFEEQIEFESDEYNTIEYCYPNENPSYPHQDCSYFYDEDITINGGKGTYFTIDQNTWY